MLDSCSVWSHVTPRTTASPPSRAPSGAGKGVGRHNDQFGDATADGAQRRAADRKQKVLGRDGRANVECFLIVLVIPFFSRFIVGKASRK
jgi:hypothetical protein